MPWTYREFTDPKIDVVLDMVGHHLRTLTPDESNTVKLETSDQRGDVGPVHAGSGLARGLVVWSAEPNPPPPPTVFSLWSSFTWSADSSYDDMYRGLVGALNGGGAPDGRAISPASAYWSRIAMSNMLRGAATLTLFWRAP